MTLVSSFGARGLRAYVGCLLFIGSSLPCLTFPPVLLRCRGFTCLESSSQVCFRGDLARDATAGQTQCWHMLSHLLLNSPFLVST